ncbi:MAG TPA: PepSY domain-containing protein [Fluviicoccus sp.]|nr:PepSY domain-containing protein [Fluviicoccus sp.]
MKHILTAAALMLASGLASAAADCPKAPQSQWLPVLEMQKKIVNEYGFAIKRFVTDGNCYEIYGWGLNEAKTKFVEVEVYFNPVTGAIVKKKVRD